LKRYRRLIKRLIILLVLITVFRFGSNNVRNVNNPNDIMVLVNYKNQISKDYVPDDLVVANIEFTFNGDDSKKQMRKPAALAIEKMFDEAKNKGINLYGVSGYRSADRQKQIFDDRVQAVGELKAKEYVALPGESEHQTGLAMDVGRLEGNFGQSEEGKWLRENAHKFGFILRYPEEKEHITKINYEPWHFRYIGIKPANEIYNSGLTLEEYLEEIPVYKEKLSLIVDAPRKLVASISKILNKVKSTGILSIYNEYFIERS
jgi:LAS superfamily LD-carboxypeptidase LdcB